VAPQGTIVPTGTGVVVKGLVTGVVRVQIQTPDGGTNPDERWCYALDAEEMAAMESEDGVRIPWTAFNTTCWEAGGVDYNFEPISTLLLQAKDNQIKSSDTTFEMCLIDVSTYEGEDTEDTETEDTETEDTETGDTDSGSDSAK
jgi:hypothetical protein